MSLSQRIVPFHGDELVAVQQEDGTILVVFPRLCENLGLNTQAQRRRISRHAVLSAGLITLTIQTRGGPQVTQCLKLSLLPLWLSGIETSRVKDELRDKLIRYQHEAADVLWQYFRKEIMQEEPPADEGSTLAIRQLEQVIEQSKAMQKMAEEQIQLIRRMDAAARVVKGLQIDVQNMHVRLGVLEERLHPSTYITEEQAAQVQAAVNAIAMELTRHDSSKNHFQSIHAELHRRFKVRSYNLIRQEQYQAVLAFLDEWQRNQLAGGGPEQE